MRRNNVFMIKQLTTLHYLSWMEEKTKLSLIIQKQEKKNGILRVFTVSLHYDIK